MLAYDYSREAQEDVVEHFQVYRSHPAGQPPVGSRGTRRLPAAAKHAEGDTVMVRRKVIKASVPLEASETGSTPASILSLHSAQIITVDGSNLTVSTCDGRTGDRHEFHMSEGLIHATLDSGGSTVSVWASEPALPYGSYDPGVGVESRVFRLRVSRAQAEGLRDQLVTALKRRR